ncbi:hypothetical protein DPQ33_18175 [Oceanidesulfovibrio indonesiensis]|uniref:Elp3/MiaA/NifB-like radical SAM core domain-containing protein n=2 Tax=Oceanidesulfovibrio indonesiensis TaxID=54767 RepID=A0A7M3MAE4_9BACT|nr:hypothetical protein DPQ33_18175 [Oceanidesulfovibrio indonesiensis]
MGLMKLSRYHKLLEDDVLYVVGKNKEACFKFWDKVYVTSVFTYDYKHLIDTVKYYSGNLFNFGNMVVGGVAATLLSDKVEKETGVKVHQGLLNQHDSKLEELAKSNSEYAYLLKAGCTIDNLPPDYDIVADNTKYSKIIDNSFFMYSTKGCPNKCAFCAVRKLEPKYVDYIPIKPRIEILRSEVGDRAGLLLLDNNIAASDTFFQIIDEIKDSGYAANEKMVYQKNGRTIYKKRFVDFNQGVDLRLLDEEKMKALATIAIDPLRLAFDDISLADQYIEKTCLAISCGIKRLSNYMLFNFKDKPEDLYKRMEINTQIIKDHQDENVKIFSFPMRYSPIDQTNRSYIGKHWTKREIRAVQLILQATHGIVSHSLSQDQGGKGYFYRAFGGSEREFCEILWMPYHYIVNRDLYEYKNTNINDWKTLFKNIKSDQFDELKLVLSCGRYQGSANHSSSLINKILEHYVGEHTVVVRK